MSWPTVWQSQNLPPANAAQAPMNMAMFAQMTPEQQFVMQQQNWQQWQLFQQQYNQWHAQYGEQVKQRNILCCLCKKKHQNNNNKSIFRVLIFFASIKITC